MADEKHGENPPVLVFLTVPHDANRAKIEKLLQALTGLFPVYELAITTVLPGNRLWCIEAFEADEVRTDADRVAVNGAVASRAGERWQHPRQEHRNQDQELGYHFSPLRDGPVRRGRGRRGRA